MVKKAVDGSFSDSSNSFIRQVGLAKKSPLQYCMTMVELSSRQPTLIVNQDLGCCKTVVRLQAERKTAIFCNWEPQNLTSQNSAARQF